MPFSYCTIVLKSVADTFGISLQMPLSVKPNLFLFFYVLKGWANNFFEAGLLNTEQVYLEYSKSSLI